MAAADGGAIDAPSPVGDDQGEATRRLSDKILVAFNHAYAVGEMRIAEMLRDVLAQNLIPGGGAERRSRYDPLGKADRWVAFVEARNRYRDISEAGSAAPEDAEAALAAMKDAYQRWACG